MGFKKEAILGIALALWFSAGWLVAQAPTGDITGVVRDESGGVVQGAAVVATSTATEMSRESRTGEDGSYRIPVLPPGEYELSVEAEGFQSRRS